MVWLARPFCCCSLSICLRFDDNLLCTVVVPSLRSAQRTNAQAGSDTSSFRTHGTWTRKLIPASIDVSPGTYELPPLNVKGIASDLVMILMAVGTFCLAVAVYGACSSRRSKKWDSVYDGA